MGKSLVSGMLAPIRAELKQHGFSWQGMIGVRRRAADSNAEVIAFQKSRESTPGRVLLAVNYGVHSRRVAKAMGDDPEVIPIWGDLHWRKRARFDGSEWLTLEDNAECTNCLRQVIDETVLQDLEAHSTDEGLKAEWEAGRAPGLTGMQRLLFLLILQRDLDPSSQLFETVTRLRGLVANSVHEGLIERHLARLGINGRE